MKFTIVVPTYNEEKDIAGTLGALLSIDYSDKEILVVDDSTDRTPEIVRMYAACGVRLIHPGGGGRCEARNLGIQQAEGEILCILNADVRPRPDFLQRLAQHYEHGADYVLVGARISNTEYPFARYVGAMADAQYNEETDPDLMEWTEGFSCTKKVALEAGLFPEGYAVPICAGEDGFFGIALRKNGARKVVDFSIVVDHIAPSSFEDYWRIRRGRGAGSAQVHRFLDRWSYPRLILWNALKIIKTALYVGTVIPVFWICARAASHSPKGWQDIVLFAWAWLIEQVAFHVGEWKSTFEIMVREHPHAASR
ncbi:MAG: glycosyltransferase family 2 protein [Burkholderiales bacterium]